MTTVAYKEGIMAADSCWSLDGSVDTLSRKIYRLPRGGLFGQAGDNDIREILSLLERVKSPSDLPSRSIIRDIKSDFCGILVFPQGRIFKIAGTVEANQEDDIGVWEVNMPFTATGSGKDLAIGAMAAGKSAKQAVAIACRFDTASRPPVYEVPLIPEKAKRK